MRLQLHDELHRKNVSLVLNIGRLGCYVSGGGLEIMYLNNHIVKYSLN